MEWYLPWTWNLDESTFAGMMGGLILGVCRLLLSLGVVIGGKMMPADTEDIMNTPAGPHV